MADTIVLTVEVGVQITDATVDGDTTVLWCDLLTDGPARVRAARWSDLRRQR